MRHGEDLMVLQNIYESLTNHGCQSGVGHPINRRTENILQHWAVAVMFSPADRDHCGDIRHLAAARPILIKSG
jgi:hypothetical protein